MIGTSGAWKIVSVAAGIVIGVGGVVTFSTGGPSARPNTGVTCDLNATTATYSAQLTAAAAGQTVCLAAGTYTWVNATKTTPGVTIAPQSGAAVIWNAFVSTSTNLTVDGSNGSMVVNDDSSVCAQARNMAFKHFTFTGHVFTIQDTNGTGDCSGAQQLDQTLCTNNQCVLIDHATFNDNDWDGDGGAKARIHILSGASQPAGIVISNNTIGDTDGNSACSNDGIQTGGNGVLIENNYFHEMGQNDVGTCPPGGGAASAQHSDSIQLLGASNTVIKNNYSFNNAAGFVSFDGSPVGGQTNTTISNNLFVGGGNTNTSNSGVVFIGDTGSSALHNTMVTPELPVGLSFKAGESDNSGITVRDNIITGISLNNGETTANIGAADHNLCSGGCTGQGTTGSPTFVGGTDPILQYVLAGGSAGKGAASDGTDVGANLALVGIGNG